MKEWLRNIQSHLFTTEEVVGIKSTVVGKEADGCTEVMAEMCGENKQHLFHIETEKVSTLPYLDQGHGAQQCPMEESLTSCNFYFCTSAMQVTRLRQLEGQRAESQHWRHTHTPKHFISITNNTVRYMIHNVQIQFQMMLFTAEHQKFSWWSKKRRHGNPNTWPLLHTQPATSVWACQDFARCDFQWSDSFDAVFRTREALSLSLTIPQIHTTHRFYADLESCGFILYK